MNWTFRTPRDVVFAAGAIQLAPELVKKLGRRPLVCTDTYLSGTEPFKAFISDLESVSEAVTVFTGVEPELPLACLDLVVDAGQTAHADVIVGYGGGSAIDLAKLAAVTIAQPGDIARFYGEQKIETAAIPIVAIPTTAGTGSEVTAVAVVGDHRRELKVGVSSDKLIPAAAVVDPALTVGCPPSVTAHSGADAICHAVEAFTARRTELETRDIPNRIFIGKNPQSDPLALRAIGLLTMALPQTLHTPADLSARTAMAEGSLLAGMAFGNAGTTAAHALQYPLGALTKTPHGLGVGLLLPYTLATILSQREAELAEVGAAMGVIEAGDSGPEAAMVTIRALRQLMLDAGIPRSLAEIGVQASDLEQLRNQALTVRRLLDNHAAVLDRAAVLSIYQAAHRGDDPLDD